MKNPKALLPFLELEQGTIDKKKIFAHRQDLVKSQLSGIELHVDRVFTANWVNVIALTDDDEIVLVRQWRFGTQEFSVEIPAGALERGEDPIVGGLRELVEETGYTPVDVAPVQIGVVRPNAAFMNNHCFTVLVPRAKKTHAQKLDPAEEVEVLTVPRTQVDELVRTGVIDNGLVVSALHFFHLYR